MLIKAADDNSKRLALLDELQKSDRLDQRQKNWLREEFHRLRKGASGERDAAFYLQSFNSGKNHAVLHDLRIEADGQTAQIDHLILNRMGEFFLLETKTFGGSLHVNEHGEFHVEYPGERKFGIESPLEQSRRHEKVLRKVLDRIGVSGRAGVGFVYLHLVLVHPKAIIHRPPKDAFDSSMIIKADQFETWHGKFVDMNDGVTAFKNVMNLRSAETIREWGELLLREHRPANPLALPEFMAPKRVDAVVTPVRPAVTAPERAVETAMPSTATTGPASSGGDKIVCAICGKALTESVINYCQSNAKRFRGAFYCYNHQSQRAREDFGATK